jgi:hypothetical protein
LEKGGVVAEEEAVALRFSSEASRAAAPVWMLSCCGKQFHRIQNREGERRNGWGLGKNVRRIDKVVGLSSFGRRGVWVATCGCGICMFTAGWEQVITFLLRSFCVAGRSPATMSLLREFGQWHIASCLPSPPCLCA